MQRRDFLGSYSLLVLAPDLAGASPSVSVPSAAPPGPEPHMRWVELTTDVLVAGGGLAGVCAALAAARHGVKVVLVQDRSRLGGNSSSEIKMHVCGANASGGRPGWREGGLIEELRLEDAVRNPQSSFELWDLLLYDKVLSEPNITLLLDSAVYSAATENGRIRHVLVRSDHTEHIYRIQAALFCDCTGDSRLALEAGAEMHVGREARAEFGESLAPEKSEALTQGSSIIFTSRLHDRPMPFSPPRWARRVTRDQLRLRSIHSWEYGYWWIEWGGRLDTVHDDARIRHELLAIVMGVWDYIKNSGDHPSSANWAMDWIGMIPGKRESRRMVGDHILIQADLMRGEIEDAVAIGGWSMDDHPSGGFDDTDLKPAHQVVPPDVYNIPLRSLYSRNIANLMMAGRNISASHVAFSSTRVMATCAVMGQAAGTAAALCLAHHLTPRELYQRKPRMQELQQVLLTDDQTIRGARNRDPLDLARTARATASAEEPGAPAAAVLDGCSRDIPGKESHHWAGQLTSDGPWIELAWPAPQTIGCIQITFDTGFERPLTITKESSYAARMIRGPQPETVRDYTVSYRASATSAWVDLATVAGNYQRLRRHQFAPVQAQAVRIHITATNGDTVARIFEIRCYR
jgi:hypothetical protein